MKSVLLTLTFALIVAMSYAQQSYTFEISRGTSAVFPDKQELKKQFNSGFGIGLFTCSNLKPQMDLHIGIQFTSLNSSGIVLDQNGEYHFTAKQYNYIGIPMGIERKLYYGTRRSLKSPYFLLAASGNVSYLNTRPELKEITQSDDARSKKFSQGASVGIYWTKPQSRMAALGFGPYVQVMSARLPHIQYSAYVGLKIITKFGS